MCRIKRIFKVGLILYVLLFPANVLHAEKAKDTNYPTLRSFAHIFTDYNINLNNNSQLSGFEITRAHFGLSADFNENFAGIICYDATNPGNNSTLDRSGYLKQAFLQYRNSGITVNFGLIPLKHFDLLENFWGYRYIYKSSQEIYGLGSYYDIGSTIEYLFNKNISIDGAIINGEGLFKNQSDNTLKGGFGLTLNLLEKFVLREYIDYTKKTEAQITVSNFFGYKMNEQFSVGVEYNLQENNNYINNHNLQVVSVYSTYKLSSLFNIFARYDKLSSNDTVGTAWNIDNDGQKIIGGIEYVANEYVRFSANYQDWIPDETNSITIQKLFLNFEIKY